MHTNLPKEQESYNCSNKQQPWGQVADGKKLIVHKWLYYPDWLKTPIGEPTEEFLMVDATVSLCNLV